MIFFTLDKSLYIYLKLCRVMITNKPYDLTTIYAISDNNPEFLEKLLLVFTDAVGNDITALKVAANNNDWPEVGQLAHKIKPSLSHFGITSLTDIIRGLEHNSGTDPSYLKAMVIQLDNVMNNVLMGLKEEFPAVFK
jgi:HPt (histidine-containing phosphotransfer) domain-containing protein